jgi:hypothetical protein
MAVPSYWDLVAEIPASMTLPVDHVRRVAATRIFWVTQLDAEGVWTLRRFDAAHGTLSEPVERGGSGAFWPSEWAGRYLPPGMATFIGWGGPPGWPQTHIEELYGILRGLEQVNRPPAGLDLRVAVEPGYDGRELVTVREWWPESGLAGPAMDQFAPTETAAMLVKAAARYGLDATRWITVQPNIHYRLDNTTS